MLLDRLVVLIPAQEEIDADLSEYGELSLKCREQFGSAAVYAGDPDRDFNDPQTSAGDTIANILHWLKDADGDPEKAIRDGLMHFQAEVDGG